MKILFIYPSTGKWEIASKKLISANAYLPPLGILYLGRMLENHGHSVEVIDCNVEGINEESIKKKVQTSDVVGMTIYSEPKELATSIRISKLVKQFDPTIPLVIGGPHCSLCPIDALQKLPADICVQGDGEFIITQIVEAIAGNIKLSSIPGIYYRQKNGKIKHTKQAKQIENLDIIPFPARHLVDHYEYGFMLGTKITKGKVTSIITSRGCPHHCRFCQIHSLIPRFRTRSVENITKEIEEMVNNGYSTLVFVDDNFLAQKKKAEKVMDFIIKKGMNIKINIANARVDSADRQLYEKMRDAGVKTISFGIESGAQEILDFYNKNIDVSQAKEAIKLAKKMGFFISANFIFGAPIERKRHIKKTIKFAKSVPLDSAIFYNFGYLYGSDIWKEAVHKKKIRADEFWVIAESKKGLGHFTEDELIDINMKAYRNFYFNPRFLMREVYKAFMENDFSYLKVGLRMLF